MSYIKLTKEKSNKLSQKSTNQELLRAGIIAELDATSLYQSQIENTSDNESKKVLQHIMDEEKEHIAELTCVLMKQDPNQEKYIKKFLKSANINEIDCGHISHNED